MGKRDVEPDRFAGSWPLVTNSLRHQSRSIGPKRDVLSVVVTVKLPNAFDNFSSCAELRYCEAIEWE